MVGRKGRDRVPVVNGRARRGKMVRCRMGDWVELLPRHKKPDAEGGRFSSKALGNVAVGFDWAHGWEVV